MLSFTWRIIHAIEVNSHRLCLHFHLAAVNCVIWAVAASYLHDNQEISASTEKLEFDYTGDNLNAGSRSLDSKSVSTHSNIHTPHSLTYSTHPQTCSSHTHTHKKSSDVYFMLCWPSLCTPYLSQARMKHSYTKSHLHIKQSSAAKFGWWKYFFYCSPQPPPPSMFLLSSRALSVWHCIAE